MLEKCIPWKQTDKPCLNHWYRTNERDLDYWKVVKDFHSPETNLTYYKIVEYHNGDVMYCGSTLAQARQLIRENTYKMVVTL